MPLRRALRPELAANRVEIEGRIATTEGLRHTPAGLPTMRLRLAHASEQSEAGQVRRVACEFEVQAFGTVAAALAGLPVDRPLRLIGFLDRQSARSPQPVLHVTEFELIKE